MKLSRGLSFQFVYYLSSGFFYGAALLRSLFFFADNPALNGLALGLLAVWLALFLVDPFLTRRWQGAFVFYLLAQSALAAVLLSLPGDPDFYAVLFAVLAAQVMLALSFRMGVAVVAGFTLLKIILLAAGLGVPMALGMGLIYAAADALFASYALLTRRTQAERTRNLAMVQELEEKNRQLQALSRQLEQLSVARERNRLARELHDSVTQTIFSMTLVIQSALLLLEREPAQVAGQLERLNQLGQGALGEMQTLIAELRPQIIPPGSLAEALRRHLAERQFPENLAVLLEVDGDQPLTPAEEQGLFRIAQEALNNVVKHAGAAHAAVRLHLAEPMWLEISDDGRGFDPPPGGRGSGVGLGSMAERAAEIGWELTLESAPGRGTRVRAERKPPQEKGSEHG